MLDIHDMSKLCSSMVQQSFPFTFRQAGVARGLGDRDDKKLVAGSRDFPLALAFSRLEETEKTATQAS